MEHDDFELLKALSNDDMDAFNTLFKKYYIIMCAYCRKYVELESAEDITQDVMLWLWENRKTMNINTSLNQYLFTMVYHRIINKLARDKVRLRSYQIYYEETLNTMDEYSPYMIKELSEKIDEAIASLPISYREAFIMNRYNNMTHKQIAEKEGVSVKTIDYRIQRALDLLRDYLKDYLPVLFALLNKFM